MNGARHRLLQLAKCAEKCQHFAVLCVDEGLWPQEIIKEPVTTGGFKVMSKCKGVTRAHLMEDLDAEALQSIRECFDRLMAFAESENIIGVTADFGNLWLKHHSAVRKLITEVPVYLTPIVQLPMISASFKSREQTLLVTWGSQKDVEKMKPRFMSDCNIVMDLDRLEILGVDVSQDVRWARYLSFDVNAEEVKSLGVLLTKMVEDRIAEVNSFEKKDLLIKSLIVTTRLSRFSDLLRQSTGLPVFDEITMLNLFASASALSHFNDAKVLCRLSDKLEHLQHPKSPSPSPGSPRGSPGSTSPTSPLRPNSPTSPTTSLQVASASPKLGVLQLEYEYPRAFGDVDHPGTFGFKTCPRIVKGLTFERAQAGSFDPDILEHMKNEIKHLEDQKVVGITGNCGFMMYYQCYARHVSDVPVFMSALIQAATMAAAMEPSERVLILTANAAMLQPGKDKLLLESGIQVTRCEKFVIRGCENLNGFEAVANAERVDTIRVQKAICDYVSEIIQEENSSKGGPIKMVLLECTELPHYADALRRSTRLPVFDAVTCVNYFYRAAGDQNWNAKAFPPHNPSFWANFTEGAVCSGNSCDN